MKPNIVTPSSLQPRSTKWLMTTVLVTVLGFSLICGYVLLNMRKAAWELARQSNENLASTMDSEITRNVELYDLSLRAVVANINVPELHQVSPAVKHLILFDHAATAKHFGPIKVFDADGKLIINAETLDPIPEQIADQTFFKMHQNDPSVGLLISPPASDKTGEYSIKLSRRITDATGAFAGVVVGSIHLSYFHDLFRRIELGEDDSLTLILNEGILVMRRPFQFSMIGKDLSRTVGVKKLRSHESGWFEAAGAVDKTARQYVWRDGKQPLVVLVGKSLNGIYAAWRADAFWILLAMLVLGGIAATAAVLLAFEMHKRDLAERRYAQLAKTDGLTGLNNRRHFDEVLDAEWRRSQRSGLPVALLMIDADHFKSFNDTYGHQAGDQVLINIAKVIGREGRRSTDCAARYGGEEFGLILPGLSAELALLVGERVREAVERLSANGVHITVSIGVASIAPRNDRPESDLIACADAALYEAKQLGRNRCRIGCANNLALAA